MPAAVRLPEDDLSAAGGEAPALQTATVHSPSQQRATSASKELGLLRVHLGRDRAYIQQWLEEEHRWKLVVNIMRGCCQGRHAEVATSLMKAALRHGATVAQIQSLKKTLTGEGEDVE